MRKCNCNYKCDCGLAKGPQPDKCECKPDKVTLRTAIIPANLGDDTGAYAPKPGNYYNTVVTYAANDNVYVYDSNGVFTLIRDGVSKDELADIRLELDGIEISLDELFYPTLADEVVDTLEELKALDPADYPATAIFEVLHDEDHNNGDSLYYYDAGLGEFVFKQPATPYYTKSDIVAFLAGVDEQIEAETEAREQADNNLDEKITTETTAREAADKEINDKIEEIINSPDVRYIVDTYADLAELTGVGDKDYARVLKDETHEDASTYYQYDLADTAWNYVGATGPYYTKTEIDDKLADLPTVVQETGDSETDVMSQKAVTEALAGAGGSVSALQEYNATPEENDVYSAGYTNTLITDTFDTDKETLKIGGISGATTAGLTRFNVVIGPGAKVMFPKNSDCIAIGRGAMAEGPSANSGNQTTIAIGRGASASYSSIAIGDSATTPDTGSPTQRNICIGTNAKMTSGGDSVVIGGGAQSYNSTYGVALGAGSRVDRSYTVSIGNSTTSQPYSTRYLANVKAGEEDTDAVNVKQMKDYVAANAGGSKKLHLVVEYQELDLNVAEYGIFTAVDPNWSDQIPNGHYIGYAVLHYTRVSGAGGKIEACTVRFENDNEFGFKTDGFAGLLPPYGGKDGGTIVIPVDWEKTSGDTPRPYFRHFGIAYDRISTAFNMTIYFELEPVVQ